MKRPAWPKPGAVATWPESPEVMSPSSNWWPKEHGAYAQLLLPLGSLALLAPPHPASLAFGLAAGAGFLAHEPLAVASGLRGKVALQARGREGRRRALALGALGAAGGVGGLALSWPASLGACAWVALGLVGLGALLWTGREKRLGGELAIALVLASAGLPGARAAGLPWPFLIQVVALWWFTFALGILSVHGLLRQAKGQGDRLRWVSAGAGGAGLLLALGLALQGHRLALAGLPPALLSLALPALGVGAKDLKRVGWSMVAADVGALAWLLWCGPGA